MVWRWPRKGLLETTVIPKTSNIRLIRFNQTELYDNNNYNEVNRENNLIANCFSIGMN